MSNQTLTSLLQLTDQEVLQPIVSKPIKLERHDAFIPPFPLRVLQIIVEAKAEKALPVVLVIHRQLHMTKRETTPLNAAIWHSSGNPTARERENIIKKLKLLSNIIVLEEVRTVTSRYRVGRGSDWL